MDTLYEFLGFKDPKSSLQKGRDEIVIDMLSRDKAVEFLEAGFSEAGISVPRETLQRVIDTLYSMEYLASSHSMGTQQFSREYSMY